MNETMILALRTLLARALSDPGTIADALDEVERLAPAGGSGRFFLVVDLKDGRRAWVQPHAIQTFRSQAEIGRRSFNIIQEAPSETTDVEAGGWKAGERP